jgi:hypothetical protein
MSDSPMTATPGISPAGEPVSFEGCLQRVNPSKAALENLAAQPDDTPIIMLNLLRFRPRGDSSIYKLYAREAAPEVKKVGSFVGFFGAMINDLDPELGFDNSWDGVVLPVYQRRKSFLDLQRSERYQLAIPYRSAGTSRRTLYVLSDDKPLLPAITDIQTMFTSGSGFAIKEEEMLSIELLRFKNEQDQLEMLTGLQMNATAEVLLSVRTEVPVLSESLWDHCLVRKFPSRSALQSFYQDAPTSSTARLRVACQSVALPQ